MCIDGYLNLKLVGQVYSSFGHYFEHKTCRAICNAYQISIMVHFCVYEWLFELENGKSIYNSSSIPIMVHFGLYGWLFELGT